VWDNESFKVQAWVHAGPFMWARLSNNMNFVMEKYFIIQRDQNYFDTTGSLKKATGKTLSVLTIILLYFIRLGR
jgi:hypothetical protein